jgi:hypothetical protein
MKWEKLGLIYCPSGEMDWTQSHAAVPVAEHIEGDIFKVYFSSRDKNNRSSTGFVVIDINRPGKIIELSSTPVLVPGELGEFDDSGAMGAWIAKYNGVSYFYYIGWNLGVTVPFRNSIGLAVSTNGQTYSRISSGPIVDRTMSEPHFCASCCVIPDVDVWRMWYLSCTGWSIKNNFPVHSYHIKYAESENGVDWKRDGYVSINYSSHEEYAISRPSVIREKDTWKMWYSYRGQTYRIGYAESLDGRKWKRFDNLSGIDVSAAGWDSEMIEYPFVLDHNGQRYMFYNGNGYGKSGFGLAALK